MFCCKYSAWYCNLSKDFGTGDMEVSKHRRDSKSLTFFAVHTKIAQTLRKSPLQTWGHCLTEIFQCWSLVYNFLPRSLWMRPRPRSVAWCPPCWPGGTSCSPWPGRSSGTLGISTARGIPGMDYLILARLVNCDFRSTFSLSSKLFNGDEGPFKRMRFSEDSEMTQRRRVRNFLYLCIYWRFFVLFDFCFIIYLCVLG